MMTDAEHCRHFRELRGLTRHQLAHLAGVGWRTVKAVERGESKLKGNLWRYLMLPPHAREPIIIDPMPPTAFTAPDDDLTDERATLVTERARLVELIRTMDTRVRQIDTRLRNGA